MKARNVMTIDVTTISPEASLKAAHLAMTELGVRHLPVVASGRLVGLVSDRDVLQHARLRKGRLQLDDTRVRDVMTARTLTLGPKAKVSEAARLMVDEKIDCVPIVGEGRKLEGLLTSSDLLLLLTDVRPPVDTMPFFSLRHAED